MEFSTTVLGAGAVRYLRQRADQPVITIGRDRFTRGTLASVECFSFHAAARLEAALKRLRAKDTRDVFERLTPEQLALPAIGAVAFAVLGACFEARAIGTLDSWVRRSLGKDERIVTIDTIKERIARETTTTTRRRAAPRTRRAATTPSADTPAVH
jgi:hypothetical protein